MTEFDFDRHDRTHEDPREHKDDCDICEARFQERVENGEYDDIVFVPAPGTIGIGVGRLLDPIIERGEDPAGHFESVFWFPADQREAAEEAVALSEGRWVLREGVAL